MKAKTARDLILTALRRGSKKGLSAKTIADRTGLRLTTVQTVLHALKKGKQVKVADNVFTGDRGRPANLYVL